MTDLSPRNAYPAGWRTDPPAAETHLRRLIARARVSLAAERIVPTLWPAFGIVGLYFTAALLGLFTLIPWGLQALLLAATITVTGLALDAGFAAFTWPSQMEGARRLERDNGLKHRPISERDDILVGRDPIAQALWHHHQARVIAADRLRVAWPDADLNRHDPKNLRLFVLIALVAAFIVAGAQWRARLISAFDSGAGAAVTLDAWADPPAYTGLAPVYLAAGDRNVIAVPFGAILNLRAHGASRPPGVSLGGDTVPSLTGAQGEYSGQARLTQGGHLRVRAAGHRIADWNLRVIADRPPMISFAQTPSATARGAVAFAIKAGDDYGVTAARVVIRPHGKPGAPLIVGLPLAQASNKNVTQTTYDDLTGHPYAGLLVDAQLEARDGADQLGKSKTVTFRLPARVFTDPLARALIEQRQDLATSSDSAGLSHVAAMLDALAIAPERFYAGKLNIYTGLRAAYWGVRAARSLDDLGRVEDLLWQIATAMEQNGLLSAADDLRALQALISQALAAHAPQQVIDQLLQRYNQEMQKYLSAMAANPQAAQQQQPDANAKTLQFSDLETLMKAIQQLSAAGARDEAAKMLAMLQNMLENMRMAQGSPGQSGADKQLNDAMQQYGDLMGQQRALMDQTMRQRQGGGTASSQDLAKAQGALRDKLNDAMKKLSPPSGTEKGGADKGGSALDKAGQAMAEAERALSGNDLDNAGNAQQKALAALRAGADALARQQQKGQGQEGGNDDPLGRSRMGLGNSIKLPDASDMARARSILEELRRRAGELGRPQEELDYLDRLLKEF